MKEIHNIGVNSQENTQQNEVNISRRAFLLAMLSGSATLLAACAGIEIPEDCDESITTIRGVASTLFESGFTKEQVQSQINQICD